MIDEAPAVSSEASWASCHVVVGAYGAVAPAVRRAVERAEALLLRTPMLADFVELRFVSVGARPEEPADLAAAAGMLVTEACRPARSAPENFLAALVVDDAAADVVGLCEACTAAGPAIALDVAGIAVEGERDGAPEDLELTVLGSGPLLEERLAEAIHARCRDLLELHGSGGARGVSAQALEAAAAGGDAATLQALAAGSSLVDASAPIAGPVGPPTAALSGAASRRWIGPPVVRPSRGPSADDSVPTVHLVLLAGAGTWRQVRAQALGIDRWLASDEAPATGGVEVVWGDAERARRNAPAGRLRSRHLRSPREAPGRAAAFRQVERTLAASQGVHGPRPVVVVIADEPPVADVDSLAAHASVAARATIVWVLASGDAGLLSIAYSGAATAVIEARDGPVGPRLGAALGP